MKGIKVDIVKAVSWRIVGTLDTAFVSWLITGNLKISIGIASVEVLSKIVLFVLHERLWRNIQHQQRKKNEGKVVSMYE